MSAGTVLGERALREAKRTPDALLPTLLIPLFFLVVNVGQAGRIFPTGSTSWLEGQGYAAPVSRTSIALGRLTSEAVKTAGMTVVIVLIALPFGVTVASGVVGCVLLVLLAAGWAVGYAAFLQFVALKTRSGAATNSAGLIFFPLLFLTPNFVPRELLTRPMEIAATLNPVTYVMEAMRSLILVEFDWAVIGKGFVVVAVFVAITLSINVRTMKHYD
jgi:ABC-2 type transport system permease protein